MFQVFKVPIANFSVTALSVVYLVFSLITFRQSGVETNPQTIKVAGHPLEIQQDFSLISGFHLFGQSADASITAGLPAKSTQALQLKGVLYLPDHQAHAIIESTEHSQKNYRINDTVPGGAVLQAINANSIILVTDNGQESLTLDKTKIGQTVTTDSIAKAQPNDDQQPSENDIVIQPPESLAN